MKTKFLIALCGSLITSPLCMQSHAQQYSINWYKFAGGGGTSTGGVYSVSSTIGQQDAGAPMTGGIYSLTGGFWSLVGAVQTTAAPFLTITPNSTNLSVTVSWPSPSSGFVLQQSASLQPANWMAVTNSPVNIGATMSVTLPVSPGTLFFRLMNPE